MSIKTDVAVKEHGQNIRALQNEVLALMLRVDALEKNIIEGDVDASVDVGDLVTRYEQKFGRPPHHRMKPETIEQALLGT